MASAASVAVELYEFFLLPHPCEVWEAAPLSKVVFNVRFTPQCIVCWKCVSLGWGINMSELQTHPLVMVMYETKEKLLLQPIFNNKKSS